MPSSTEEQVRAVLTSYLKDVKGIYHTDPDALKSSMDSYLKELVNIGQLTGLKIAAKQDPADSNVITVELTIHPRNPIMFGDNQYFQSKDSDEFGVRYLDETLEYPKDMPWNFRPGVFYAYVSSTMINGFINGLKPVAASVIGRYQEMDESLDRADNKRTKREQIEFFNAEPGGSHTKLSQFGDDILMLGHVPDADGGHTSEWGFFWFDCDVSDCCIGRFTTKDPEADVIRRFQDFADERSINMGYCGSGEPASKLDVTKFKGWISF